MVSHFSGLRLAMLTELYPLGAGRVRISCWYQQLRRFAAAWTCLWCLLVFWGLRESVLAVGKGTGSHFGRLRMIGLLLSVKFVFPLVTFQAVINTDLFWPSLSSDFIFTQLALCLTFSWYNRWLVATVYLLFNLPTLSVTELLLV